MVALSMHMVPTDEDISLATKTSSEAPSWVGTSTAITARAQGHFDLPGRRNIADVFRLPNRGGVLRDWLYSRPVMEAIEDEALYKSSTECTTIFRIEGFDPSDNSITISPTVSNHWLLVPYQTINEFTVGLCYLDITYERADDRGGNRIPPLQVGRFAMEDKTGEVFACGWRDNIMTVGWIQSIIKCERVRELMLFEAPPDNTAPTRIMMRNSFYERRDCQICGIGSSMSTLPPPCSGVSNRISGDPTAPRPLFNIATLYRRFRGCYFGACVKIRYGSIPQLDTKQLVPVYIDVRHGHFELRKRFTQGLRKNVNLVIPRRTETLFGISPRSSSRLLLLKAGEPVRKNTVVEADSLDDELQMELRISPTRRRRKVEDGSASASPHHETSSESQQGTADDSPGRTKSRIRNEDDLDRDTVRHMRKIRNRESAARANAERKRKLDAEKEELSILKTVTVPALEARERELMAENDAMREHIISLTYLPIEDVIIPGAQNRNAR